MNQKTVAIGIAACVLVGIGIFFGVTMQKNPTVGPVADVASEASSIATTSAAAEASPVAPVAQSSTVKTYTNIAFGYSFSYPAAWVLEPETSVVDAQNDMPSIVSVHDTRPFSPQRFSVTINKKERTIKNQTSKTEVVTVGGQSAAAYLFPDGLECKPTKTDPDCSFFIIPIQRNGVWYEINVANEATTLDAYRSILASFKFTK